MFAISGSINQPASGIKTSTRQQSRSRILWFPGPISSAATKQAVMRRYKNKQKLAAELRRNKLQLRSIEHI